MTEFGAELKCISRKLRARHGFSQHSLSQINMQMRASPRCGAVKIAQFPCGVRSFSNLFGQPEMLLSFVLFFVPSANIFWAASRQN
jgi:hypothetical protein